MGEALQPLSEGERDELVAHLSGELSVRESAVWQKRLENEAAVRAEAESLARVWEILDALPMPEPSPGFASRVSAAARSNGEWNSPQHYGMRRRILAVVACLGASLLAGVAGFDLASRYAASASAPGADALTESRLEELRAVRDIDFLRALHREKALDTLDSPGEVGDGGDRP